MAFFDVAAEADVERDGQQGGAEGGHASQEEDRGVVVASSDPAADRAGKAQCDIEEHRIRTERGTPVVRADATYRFDAECREHQRETRARQCGTGKRRVRRAPQPEQHEAKAFDDERCHCHAITAEPIDGVAEHEAYANEAATEDGQR